MAPAFGNSVRTLLHAAIHGSPRLPFGPPEYKVIPVYPDAVHVDMVLHFAELYLKPWNEKSKLVWNELLTSRVQKVWLYKTSEGDQREFSVVEIACEQKRLVYLRLNRTHFPSYSSSTSSPGADTVDEEESSSSTQTTTPKESHSTPELVTKKQSHSLSETTIAEGSHSSSQTTIPDELHSLSGTYVQTGSHSLSETTTQEESHSPSETAIPEGSLSSSKITTLDELHSLSGTYVQTGSHSLSETIVQEEPHSSSENAIKEEKISISTTSLPSVDTSASAVSNGQPTTDESIPYSPTLRIHVPHPNGYIAAYMMRRILTPPSSSYAKIVKCVSYSCKAEELPTFWELLILVNVIDEYSESYQLVERPFFWCVDMLCALLETWPRDFRDVKVDQFSFKKWYAMNSNLPYCGRENDKPVYRRKDEFVLQIWAAFKVKKEFLEQQRKRYEDDAKRPPSHLEEIMKYVERNKQVTDELIELLKDKNTRLRTELDEEKAERRELERQLDEMKRLLEENEQHGEERQEFRRSLDQRFEELQALQSIVDKRMGILDEAMKRFPMLEQNN